MNKWGAVAWLDFPSLDLPMADHNQDDKRRQQREKLQRRRKLGPIIKVTVAYAEDAAKHQTCTNGGCEKEGADDNRH